MSGGSLLIRQVQLNENESQLRPEADKSFLWRVEQSVPRKGERESGVI